ncbi:MAG: CRISPR-associated helicase Cas3' [Patescibacteria group bacterium]|nr:CRISPR-associated helicase Cas3' [Patescibacteria group bacterium]
MEINELINNYYSKSTGETIIRHIKDVENNFNCLKKYLNLKETEEYLIKKIIYYHDLGKINPGFQNLINKKLKNKIDWKYGNIPHEWLSPSFILQEEEENIKNKLKEIGLEEKDFNFFIFSILSHHFREKIVDDELITNVINDLNKLFNLNLEYYYSIKDILKKYNEAADQSLWKKFFKYRVLFNGCLLKCDYTASAKILPEEKYKGNFRDDFEKFLKQKNIKLKDFQNKMRENSDKNVILIGSTGIGKTEAAINWIDGKKAFYLLGIKVAVNEMYKRFENIFHENVSLLHGDTSYFLTQIINEEDEYFIKLNKIRKLSYPLTIATADQIITSVFKYPGFEFTYLTCSYSKIVIDEIQSFSPASIAAIIVFLKEIAKLGSKFLLMTATLPEFLIDELKEEIEINVLPPQLLNIKRHKITIVEDAINKNNLKEIISKNKNKKILIICNTVKKSQTVYEILKNNNINSNLLHAKFINRDRKIKEENITKQSENDIWITTQIVEASLDIDFDLLITECSSVESLFQRFGRCYRKREYTEKEANIYIFKSEDYNIYDKYLLDKTWKVIKKYNNMFLTEEIKIDIINQVFKEIIKTKYYEKYKKQKNLLEIGYRSLNKIEAEQDFRGITNNFLVIPENVYMENQKYISELIHYIENKNNNILDRIQKQMQLYDFLIPIQIYNKKNKYLFNINNSVFAEKHSIKILKNTNYTFEKGLETEIIENEENII